MDGSLFDKFEDFVVAVGDGEKVEVSGVDRGVRQGLVLEHFFFHKVFQLVPVLAAVADKRDAANFLRLDEGNEFKEFIEGAEAAWEEDKDLSAEGEADLAGEEVVEAQALLEIDVAWLSFGKVDEEADRFASRFEGTTIRRFHNAGTTTREDGVAELLGNAGREGARTFVIRIALTRFGGAEEGDRLRIIAEKLETGGKLLRNFGHTTRGGFLHELFRHGHRVQGFFAGFCHGRIVTYKH